MAAADPADDVPDVPDAALAALDKPGHASFCMRCLYGLPAAMAEADSSRIAVGFYCLGALDLLGLLDARVRPPERAAWRAWVWAQQVPRPVRSAGADAHEHEHVGGFRPGPFMRVEREAPAADADPPHLIMTYTALLALAVLRDDFGALDRRGLVGLLRATQQADGSFTARPGQGEADLRMVYTAFVISAMLDDWRGVDVPRALGFVHRCLSYEGGFGQAPGNEATGASNLFYFLFSFLVDFSYLRRHGRLVPYLCPRRAPTYSVPNQKQIAFWILASLSHAYAFFLYVLSAGGPTYCALAALALAPAAYAEQAVLGDGARRRTLRWLAQRQSGAEGGFGGRTEKGADACYSFWCGAALDVRYPSHYELLLCFTECGGEQILGAGALVARAPHAGFLAGCQFRVGGLAKAPGELADPYHTYLALAALALYPPDEGEGEEDASWRLPRLDALLNATEETAAWARAKISGKG
ncbi:terpenoid cyclases/Protein prenyltransferase [Phellopilus nigrolimitatus]|nr:terpenoid cyclases/Protein prenyltransferase [Phellopilus nigrolimitatus]